MNNHMLGLRTFVDAERLSCARPLNRAEPGLLQPKLQLGFPFFILANEPTLQRAGIYILSDIKSLSAETRPEKTVENLTSSSGQTGSSRDGFKPGSRAGRKHVRKTETCCQHEEGVALKR